MRSVTLVLLFVGSVIWIVVVTADVVKRGMDLHHALLLVPPGAVVAVVIRRYNIVGPPTVRKDE